MGDRNNLGACLSSGKDQAVVLLEATVTLCVEQPRPTLQEVSQSVAGAVRPTTLADSATALSYHQSRHSWPRLFLQSTIYTRPLMERKGCPRCSQRRCHPGAGASPRQRFPLDERDFPERRPEPSKDSPTKRDFCAPCHLARHVAHRPLAADWWPHRATSAQKPHMPEAKRSIYAATPADPIQRRNL